MKNNEIMTTKDVGLLWFFSSVIFFIFSLFDYCITIYMYLNNPYFFDLEYSFITRWFLSNGYPPIMIMIGSILMLLVSVYVYEAKEEELNDKDKIMSILTAVFIMFFTIIHYEGGFSWL